jgi:hypothetical protein
MKTNTFKNNSFTKRAFIAVILAAITLFVTMNFGFQKVQAADEHVISDAYATAHINADGSGYIECKKAFTSDDPLTSINGVALKDIVKFNDGGYIDQFFAEEDFNVTGNVSDIIDFIYPYIIYVHGRGPEGLGSGSGYLHFTDETNDTYDLSIWRHAEAWHHIKYNSDKATIVKFSWNS